MKFEIPKDLKNNSGIYIIRNSINSKVYIGSASDFWARFQSHRSVLKNNKHHSNRLQNFVNKYGIENLNFGIHLLCEDSTPILAEAEQKAIDQLQAANPNFGYNILSYVMMPGFKRNRGDKVCLGCGNTFKERKESKSGKYCSRKCAGVERINERECPSCKKVFKPAKQTQKACSRKCGRASIGPRSKEAKEKISNSLKKHYFSIKLPVRECLNCKGQFKPRHTKTVCCSKTCGASYRYVSDLSKHKFSKICFVCNNPFETPSHSSIYCSKKCKESNPEKNKVCAVCNKQFNYIRKSQITCSKGCANSYKAGTLPISQKKCLFCGVSFLPVKRDIKTCSRSCGSKHAHKIKKANT